MYLGPLKKAISDGVENGFVSLVASPGGFEPPLPPWKGGVLGL